MMAALREDAAVSEVLGFILMFGISAIVLVAALDSFRTARDTADDIAAATAVKLVGDRVGSVLLEASEAAAELPNATFERRLGLPGGVAGGYGIEATTGALWVNTSDGRIRWNATNFRLDQVAGLVVGGRADVSEDGAVAIIRYALDASGSRRVTLSAGDA